jgi:acyl dehydratase
MQSPLYLEDLHVGKRFISAEFRMDEARMKSFASEFDPQPFHLDQAAGDASVFRGLAASGWYTAAVTMRLLVQSIPWGNGLIGLGGEIVWPKPTRVGDILHVESEIMEIKPSRSKPGQAIVTLRSTTINQNQEPVQIFTSKVLAFRRERS